MEFLIIICCLITGAIIACGIFWLIYKPQQKCNYPQETTKPSNPCNTVDWDTIDRALNLTPPQRPTWTSWTTTVSNSGEILIEKAPENNVSKENVEKKPIKLKNRFELLKD